MDTIYKVVFHLDDEEKGDNALNNVKNLLEDIGTANRGVEIEILANSSGVKVFKKNNKKAKEVEGLIDKGVRIAICSNTVEMLGLDKERDLIEGTSIVSSGVGELTRRQADGWGYIKI